MEKGTTQNAPWAVPFEEVLSDFDVDPETGLDPGEVKKRREHYGPNRLRKAAKKSAWTILIDQFKSPIVLLLVLAAILSFSFGEWMQGLAIVVVIMVNGAIGFFTELNAVRSMEALQQMTRVKAKVRRKGQVEKIPAEDLVPGDVVVVEAGDILSADIRLLEANKMQADESALTGESVPVSKHTDHTEEDVPLA
ncbi:MAG: cation-transporting P-type ATPase [Desulfatiglandales bacterium]